MFLSASNSPLKWAYLYGAVPLNFYTCHEQDLQMFLSARVIPFYCSYLPGTVPLNVPTCQEQLL